jgi:competence protein ComEA
MSKKTLFLREWAALSIAGSLLYALIAINFRPESRPLPVQDKPPPLLEIHIEGAVQHPGTYQVRPGTFLKEVLKKAKPLRGADLSALGIKRPLSSSEAIVVLRRPSLREKKKLRYDPPAH